MKFTTLREIADSKIDIDIPGVPATIALRVCEIFQRTQTCLLDGGNLWNWKKELEIEETKLEKGECCIVVKS